MSESTVAISLAQGPDYARFVEALEALEKEGVLKVFADEAG